MADYPNQQPLSVVGNGSFHQTALVFVNASVNASVKVSVKVSAKERSLSQEPHLILPAVVAVPHLVTQSRTRPQVIARE